MLVIEGCLLDCVLLGYGFVVSVRGMYAPERGALCFVCINIIWAVGFRLVSICS